MFARFFLMGIVGLFLTLPLRGQEQESEIGQKALADIRRDMQISQQQIEKLGQEIEMLKKNQNNLSEALIASAARARQFGQKMQEHEKQLGSLLAHKYSLESQLATRHQEIGSTLAVMERIGLRPPPAILAHKADVLKSLRASSLLGAVMSDLKDRAQDLRRNLEEVERIENLIDDEKQHIKSDLQQSQIEDRRLILLLDEKRAAQRQSEAERQQLQQQTTALARKAQSLQELIEDLGAADPHTAALSQNEDQAGLVPIDPHFSRQYGRLLHPVAGIKLQSFDKDLQGELYETAPNALILSPVDGVVRYAGPFRSYGQLLIIDVGQNYHLVLAGMEKIYVQPGQILLAGEPIGIMAAAQSVDPSAKTEQGAPILYVEIRQGDQALDPAPWWANTSQVEDLLDTPATDIP